MERLFFSHQSRYSDFDVLVLQVLCPIVTLTWCVNKSNNMSSERRKTRQSFIFFQSTDDNTRYNFVLLQ